jgi:hypothetical protein
MLTNSERGPRAPSRIAGRGAIVRSLRALVFRVGRYTEYRARTADEARWSAVLFDALQSAYQAATADADVRADLARVDQRRARSQKTR